MLALKPSSGSWAPAEAVPTPQEAARELRWTSPDDPGDWTPVVRRVRDGRQETWWAADLIYGPYGPDQARRVVVTTTDPATLPPLTTWYLATNLPRPGAPHADEALFAPADLTEVVRLYGLRNWVEQGDKHRKQELGWAAFMVRSDQAIRRHWQRVLCACSFCWRSWFAATGPPAPTLPPSNAADTAPPITSGSTSAPARGEHGVCANWPAAPGLLATDAPSRSRLAGSLDGPLALLAPLVERAPAS